jgi:hypothetical protein
MTIFGIRSALDKLGIFIKYYPISVNWDGIQRRGRLTYGLRRLGFYFVSCQVVLQWIVTYGILHLKLTSTTIDSVTILLAFASIYLLFGLAFVCVLNWAFFTSSKEVACLITKLYQVSHQLISSE